jgi:hypothetical protein
MSNQSYQVINNIKKINATEIDQKEFKMNFLWIK